MENRGHGQTWVCIANEKQHVHDNFVIFLADINGLILVVSRYKENGSI